MICLILLRFFFLFPIIQTNRNHLLGFGGVDFSVSVSHTGCGYFFSLAFKGTLHSSGVPVSWLLCFHLPSFPPTLLPPPPPPQLCSGRQWGGTQGCFSYWPRPSMVLGLWKILTYWGHTLRSNQASCGLRSVPKTVIRFKTRAVQPWSGAWQWPQHGTLPGLCLHRKEAK